MEQIVLSNLLYNEKYARKVLPYLEKEYFSQQGEKITFKIIEDYVQKYNEFPSKEILYIELQNHKDLNEMQYNEAKEVIQGIQTEPTKKLQWLLDKTEEFCKNKAIYNAIKKSIKIIDAKSELTTGAIPKLLSDALSVSFDTSIGHDFIDDYIDRYELYHAKEDRIEFDIDFLNKITNGGLPDKILACLIASTGVGKTMVMCHMAAHNLMCNKNVLYITMEMAEERIAQRIDANLLGVSMQDLLDLSRPEYDKKIKTLKKSTKGKLIIKEYPTASAGSAHFRHLLNELRIKRNFVPDIVYIDYLNICTSSRIKNGSAVNSYSYIKAVAEELRGLAVEFKIPIMTATQSNRGAVNASDMELDNVSDSFGTAMTMDLILAVISTEELEEMNQLLFKQLKNRLGDPTQNRRFVVGVNRSMMRLYNLDLSDQENILDGPVFDNTEFGTEETERKKKKFDKSKFAGFH